MKYLTLVLALVFSIGAFADHVEYSRQELPQLSETILAGSDYPFELKTVSLSNLIPVQVDRVPNLKKHEKRLIKAQQDTYRPLVVDHSFHIIDGHHRYDALTELGIENVRVFHVHADISDVVIAFSNFQDDTPTVPVGYQEEVVVIGSRSTLESAIDKEEASDNLISVVDSDALGSFADSTGADAISRLSGISVENDQGEGRYVTVRGLSSDLNSVSVNGASMVAPENGRSVIMDGIPTELLDSIEVAKTLTPEMDADSIGGRISFNTKRPSELDDRMLTVKVASKFNELTDHKQAPNFSITYGDLLNDTTGHIVGLTYSNRYINSYNNETGFGWEDGFLNDDWEMRYYEVQRERYGFSYDISTELDNTMLYAGVFYNKYDESEVRLKNEYGKIKNDGFVTSRIRHDAETRVRYETRKIGAANFGFETQVSDWYLDGQVSYSWAEEDDSDNADITFRNYDKTFGGEFDVTDPQKIVFTAYDPALRDPLNLEFDAFEMWSNVSKDNEWSVQLNGERDLSFGILKVGAKYRSREKDVNDYIIVYEWDKTLADFDNYTIDWQFSNQTFGNHLTPTATYGMRDQISMMSVDFSDDKSRDFTTNEDIAAVYAQITTEWNRGVVIYGLRYEQTDWESIAFDQDGALTYAEKDYGFLAPSVTVKYYLTDNIQLRGAVWTSLSRPGFKETAPITDADFDSSGDVSGSVGNPALDPYESMNYDASIAYYGDGMTYASIGVFRKEIDNSIYPTFQRNGTFNGIDFNDGVETWINAGDSWINGLELNAQYSWDNGLYIAANITLTESESEFSFDGEETFTTDFRKLAGEAGNVSLGFDNGKWDARLAINHRGDFIDWFADEDGDITELNDNNIRYVDSHTQVDLTVKYNLNDNLTIRGEVINLTDEPEYYYWGNPNQLSQYDEFGVSYSIGFTYRL
jgi:TonB-dependent receptor